MLFTESSALLCLGALMAPAALAAPPPTHPTGPPSTVTHGSMATPAPSAFVSLSKNYVGKTRTSLQGASGDCTNAKVGIRQSWGDLSADQRKDYTRAVNCLAQKPAKTDLSIVPGAKNRLDDFTFNHINQTNVIHFDALLLPWHRAFLGNFEAALRDECDYKGYLPYWDMGAFAGDQSKSPVFDGSETSIGGNGAYKNHSSFLAPLPGLVVNVTQPKPAGTGGGCLTDGPFKDLKLSLGPVAVPASMKPNPADVYGYQANPRCLSRDFFQPASSANLTWTHVTSLVQQDTIAEFRNYLETYIHGFGHLFIGGEGADPFSTTNDPAFYLLHAQIDRLWAIWQGQDLATRQNALDGTLTFFGIPLASAPDVKPRNGTLDDTMDLGLAGKKTLKQGMSTLDNGRCYIYQ